MKVTLNDVDLRLVQAHSLARVIRAAVAADSCEGTEIEDALALLDHHLLETSNMAHRIVDPEFYGADAGAEVADG